MFFADARSVIGAGEQETLHALPDGDAVRIRANMSRGHLRRPGRGGARLRMFHRVENIGDDRVVSICHANASKKASRTDQMAPFSQWGQETGSAYGIRTRDLHLERVMS